MHYLSLNSNKILAHHQPKAIKKALVREALKPSEE